MRPIRQIQENYQCPSCGYVYNVYRKKGFRRRIGHRKWLYCLRCRRKFNFILQPEFKEI
jgi:transposase-like protein